MRETQMGCSIFEFTFERQFNHFRVLAWRIRDHETLRVELAGSCVWVFKLCIVGSFEF